MSKDKLRIYSGHVYMDIHKPIDTSGYTRETKDDLIEKVRTVICDAFDQCSGNEKNA